MKARILVASLLVASCGVLAQTASKGTGGGAQNDASTGTGQDPCKFIKDERKQGNPLKVADLVACWKNSRGPFRKQEKRDEFKDFVKSTLTGCELFTDKALMEGLLREGVPPDFSDWLFNRHDECKAWDLVQRTTDPNVAASFQRTFNYQEKVYALEAEVARSKAEQWKKKADTAVAVEPQLRQQLEEARKEISFLEKLRQGEEHLRLNLIDEAVLVLDEALSLNPRSQVALDLSNHARELLNVRRAELERIEQRNRRWKGLKFEFLKIPADSFVMGTNRGGPSEKQHKVRISRPFELMKYEVTRGMWKEVMGVEADGAGTSAQPVTGVSWLDAQEFLRKLSDLDGEYRYRLPSEAEWEYAARAGDNGDALFEADMKEQAWHSENATGLMETGTKQPNKFGLHDMIGNVYEWCADWFDENYYAQSEASDPPGPRKGATKVARGGSWGASGKDLHFGTRGECPPVEGRSFLGFRCIRERRSEMRK